MTEWYSDDDALVLLCGRGKGAPGEGKDILSPFSGFLCCCGLMNGMDWIEISWGIKLLVLVAGCFRHGLLLAPPQNI